jgi:hypothetical protein
LRSHLDLFPENFGEVGDQQGESFHQVIKSTEHRYQGFGNDCVVADYCWMLHCDAPDLMSHRKRKSSHF